jgi:hypothetical protein
MPLKGSIQLEMRPTAALERTSCGVRTGGQRSLCLAVSATQVRPHATFAHLADRIPEHRTYSRRVGLGQQIRQGEAAIQDRLKRSRMRPS